MRSKKIIDPIPVEILEKELSQERWVRTTRKGENDIYIVNNQNAPNVLKEIGRLRELTFRAAGGGTGEALDLDDFDTKENSYQQLIVWSKEDQEIIGGYRFIRCIKAIDKNKQVDLSTAHYFNFSDNFINNYLPHTIELGRSWVQPNFQPTVNPRKGLYALDNIWDGLGALTVTYPEIKYFFGKVTMYPDYNRECRDFLLHFMHQYFPDNNHLLTPIHPLKSETDTDEFDKIINGKDFKEGFKALNQFVRERGENVPPLVNIYMHLSPTMKTFGTAVNPDFGGVEETGILVTLDDIYEDKKTRHIDPML